MIQSIRVNIPERIIILLIFCLGFQVLNAQENADCVYLLEDAREAYEAGMVELVPELLLECIESNGLEGEKRNRAYRLVINSYLFDYLIDEADSLMDDFVEEFPEYRADDSDPQEFVFMLDAHLRALGIDPDSTPDLEEEVLTEVDTVFDQPVIISPVRGAGEFGNSLGFIAGGNISLPYTIEGYSMGNPVGDESTFLPLPGLQAGIVSNLILNRSFELSISMQYNLSRYLYRASPWSFTTYKYYEAQHQLMLPLSLIFKLNPENRKICYYLRGGMEPMYLLAATGRGTRSYEADLDEVLVGETDVLEQRAEFNLNAMAGGGLRIPLDHAFFYMEASLSMGLLLSNKEEYRFQNNDIFWLLYHLDSDFRKIQLSLCAGICWDLSRK